MIKNLEELIEALREELKSYGEMLALLDRQQEFILSRAARGVSESIDFIKAQGEAIQGARETREDRRRAVAAAVNCGEDASFAELIMLAPSDYRPLLQALVDENNELLSRVRRRAGQNHTALQRSVELMGNVLNSLRQSGAASIGNGHVRLPSRWLETRPLQEEAN